MTQVGQVAHGSAVQSSLDPVVHGAAALLIQRIHELGHCARVPSDEVHDLSIEELPAQSFGAVPGHFLAVAVGQAADAEVGADEVGPRADVPLQTARGVVAESPGVELLAHDPVQVGVVRFRHDSSFRLF